MPSDIPIVIYYEKFWNLEQKFKDPKICTRQLTDNSDVQIFSANMPLF